MKQTQKLTPTASARRPKFPSRQNRTPSAALEQNFARQFASRRGMKQDCFNISRTFMPDFQGPEFLPLVLDCPDIPPKTARNRCYFWLTTPFAPALSVRHVF